MKEKRNREEPDARLMAEECHCARFPAGHTHGTHYLANLKPPEQLDAIADVVLNYRPKSKQPKPRKRKKAKRAK